MALVVGIQRYYKTPQGQLLIDRMLLKMPILGPMQRKAAIARFTRTLGTLVSSGVAILDGLEITAKTAGNRVVHDAVMESRASIAGGDTISEPLKKSGVFPPMVVQMINVGEQTGGLDEMLTKIADFYDEEVDAAVQALLVRPRAHHDRVPRRDRRRHDRGHVPADLRHDQRGGPVVTPTAGRPSREDHPRRPLSCPSPDYRKRSRHSQSAPRFVPATLRRVARATASDTGPQAKEAHVISPRGRFILLSALMVTVAACDNGGSIAASGTGHVSLLLTDAPGDISAAVVTITGIYLQPGQDSLSTSDRVWLGQETVTTDLVALQNDVQALVQGVTVPAGTYSQLRFVITGGYIETEDGHIYASSPAYPGLPPGATVTGSLQMPSYAQSGLKVQLTGGLTIDDGATETLLVDFDVAQSFGSPAGNSGKWVMHPVVKASSASLAASIKVGAQLGAGVTLPTVGGSQVSLSSFHVRLHNGSGSVEEQPLTVDANGAASATFSYVDPSGGPYSVDLVAPAGLSITVSPASATPTVTPGQTAVVAFTITAITTL